MCAADIIVVDKSDASLALAGKMGADKLVKADGNEVEAVLELTDGAGAEAVIDFVGEKGTTTKGLKMTRPMGSYYVVGYGEDIRVPTVDLVITEKNIIGNLVGTWAELNELMALADRGLVDLAVVEYPLAKADQALHDLHHGKIWDLVSETVDLGESQVVREFVDHPGAVAVIALDEDDRVLLLRQYRHPVRAELWEPPAGLRDVDGEPPHVTVTNECSPATRWEKRTPTCSARLPGRTESCGSRLITVLPIIHKSLNPLFELPVASPCRTRDSTVIRLAADRIGEHPERLVQFLHPGFRKILVAIKSVGMVTLRQGLVRSLDHDIFGRRGYAKY